MHVNKLTLEQLSGGVPLKQAIATFDAAFDPAQVIQVFYVGFSDKRHLLEAYRRAGVEWRFDYHYFDLWGLFYPYLALRGKLRPGKDFAGFGIESMLKLFKMQQPETLHDALTDCRTEAELLRRVVKELKK